MSGHPQPLKTIVTEALALPVSERAAYLEQACDGDGELQRQVASLLSFESGDDGFLDRSPMANTDTPLVEGSRLGPYRIVSQLGAGGMGEVYLAERADGAFDQQVAIKVMRARVGSGELVDRFVSERQLLADLEHPNIAKLLDGGTSEDGRPYLVMDYVDGTPIDTHCESQGLTIRERLRLILEVCAAVAHAHRYLVIHRDLKPANILVTTEGKPKLLDFGIAKDLGTVGKTPDTQLLVPVTVEYASPEQLTGGAVSTASDVYSLGVVLYELLTGQSPFDGDDPLAGRSRSAPPDRPSTRVRRAGGPRARRLRRQLTGDRDHIVLRALAPKPSDRYPSVEQFAREIERHLQGLPLETRGGVLYRLRKQARRGWKGLVAAAVVLGLGAVWLDEAVERRQAEREAQRMAELTDALGVYLGALFGKADPGTAGERSAALGEMLDYGAELLTSGAFAEQPPMRAELLNAIGQVYRRQNQLDKAEPLLRESLALTRQFLPPDSDELAVAYNSFANVLRDLGQYPEARSLLLEATEIWMGNHPGDHFRLATLLNNLAGVEKDLGRFDAAIQHYREALAMKRRLGMGPAGVAKAIKNLGTALLAAGRLDEADAALAEARQEQSQAEEPELATRAGLDHHQGSIRRQRGDLAAARILLERGYATRIELYGEDHKKTVEILYELALLEQLEGHLDLAEQQLRRVIEVRRQRLGPRHPQSAEALISLARLVAERGDLEAAVEAIEEALEIFRDHLPAEHWRISEAKSLLDLIAGR